MGKIFANNETNKGLMSKTYKQLMQLNINKQPYQKMGGSYKQTFLQRREAHEKRLNIVVREIQIKTNEVSHQLLNEWPSSKNLQTINVGQGMEKGEPSYTVGGNVNWQSLYREQYGGSLK